MYEENEIEELAPWLVIIITLIGGGLRVFLLGNKGLWLEETFSMWLASHNIGDMLQWIARIDHHPPLYYLLLHFWIALNGITPSDLRMLSALFGAGTIPIIYLIGKRLSGELMGLVAAVFLALSPFNIRFAQETRMYTLLMFNAAVAIYALVWLLTDPNSSKPIGSQFRYFVHAWRTHTLFEPGSEKAFSYEAMAAKQSGWRAWITRLRWPATQGVETDLAWIVFIVFSAATLLTHNTAFLFLLAVNIFVLSLMIYQKMKNLNSLDAFQAPSLGNWVKAQVGIIVLWSPWSIAFFKQASKVYQDFWIVKPGWGSVMQTVGTFLNEYTLNQSSQAVMWILYALVLGIGVVSYRKKLTQFSFLVALFAVPFVGELIVSLRRPIFLDRTLIWTTIPLLLLLAAGIVQLRFRLLIVAVVGILGMNNLFSASDYFRFTQKENWQYPAGFVAKWVQNGDLMLFNAPWAQIPFDYYFQTYEQKYSIQVEKHGMPVDMSDSEALEPKMTESDIPRLLSLMNGHNRVWLITSQYSHTDPGGFIAQTLAGDLKFIFQRDFNGVNVQFYSAP